MIKLIVQDVMRPPAGREGEGWTVDLQVNGLPRLRRDLYRQLMGKEVQMEGSDVLVLVSSEMRNKKLEKLRKWTDVFNK